MIGSAPSKDILLRDYPIILQHNFSAYLKLIMEDTILEHYTIDDLRVSHGLLTQIIEIVNEWEGTLTGGQKLAPMAELLDELRKTRVVFGNPRVMLTKLTPDKFAAINVTLEPIWQEQMGTTHDFYYITLPINLIPHPDVVFKALECHVIFSPKGTDEPIVEKLFPTEKWQNLLEWGASMQAGLDANLDVMIGVDDVQLQTQPIPAKLAGNVVSKAHLKTFFKTKDFHFTLRQTQLETGGIGNSFAYWRIKGNELRNQYDLTFQLIFKVPKGTQTITMTAIMSAEPSFGWLADRIRNVFNKLPQSIQAIFRKSDKNRTPAERLLVGDHEEWELTLPA